MRSWLKIAASALVFGAFMASPDRAAFAGAWTLPEESGQIIASGTWTQSELAASGKTLNPNSSRSIKREARAYVEYGVKDWLTAILQPEFINQHLDAPNRASYRGLGYTQFALKARVFAANGFVLSLESGLGIPGPSDQPNRAQIGNTGLQSDWRLNAGYGFEIFSLPAFIDLSAGYRTRAGRPPNEGRADFTFGIRPGEKWLVLLQSFNSISNGPGAAGFPQQSASKFQASAVYDLTRKWSLQLGVLQTLASRRIGSETGASCALWYRF